MLLLQLATTGAALATPAKVKGVVSFEFEGVLWPREAVRKGTRSEIQGFLRQRLREDGSSAFEPQDVNERFDTLLTSGSEFGFMQPGILTIAREAIAMASAGSGVEDAQLEEIKVEALSRCCLKAHSMSFFT